MNKNNTVKACETSDPKFFGAEWKNVSRNVDNYLKDIDEKIESETDMNQLAELKKIDRCATAAKNVLSAVAIHGMMSPQTLQKYQHQMNWLHTGDPPCDSPFPLCLEYTMFSLDLEVSWPPQHFWAKLFDEQLLDSYAAEEVPVVQIKGVSSKVMILTQPQDLQKDIVDLIALCKEFEKDTVKVKFAHEPFVDQMTSFICIVWEATRSNKWSGDVQRRMCTLRAALETTQTLAIPQVFCYPKI